MGGGFRGWAAVPIGRSSVMPPGGETGGTAGVAALPVTAVAGWSAGSGGIAI